MQCKKSMKIIFVNIQVQRKGKNRKCLCDFTKWEIICGKDFMSLI